MPPLSLRIAFALGTAAATLAQVPEPAGEAGKPPAPPAAQAPAPKIALAREPDGIAVRVDGELFTVLRSKGQPEPVLYPLQLPGGVGVTRSWPLAEQAGEPRDHEHHRSVWFAHGSVGGVDFWTNRGRIVPVGEPTIDATAACIEAIDRWLAADGREIAVDARRYGFRAGAGWRAVDIDVAMAGSGGELRLGDTKEGTMALRLRPELCSKGKGATATIRDSEGRQGNDVWGKRATWVAYCGKVGGQAVTVAMFDHPDNLRHPTWWHARDYGLLAANPFGEHDFTGAPAGSGDFVLPAGQKLVLRYSILLAAGAVDDAALQAANERWLEGVRARQAVAAPAAPKRR